MRVLRDRASWTAQDELRGLDIVHGALGLKGIDNKCAADLLSSAFIPTHASVLIEAGFQTISLINDGDARTAAALTRLEAILMKLRIHTSTPGAPEAIRQFEARIEKYRAKERRMMVIGFVVIGAVLAGVGAAVYFLFVR